MLKKNLLWIYSFAFLGYFSIKTVYKIPHEFSNIDLAAYIYISIFLILFCSSDCIAYVINLLKQDQKNDNDSDKVIFFQVPSFMFSAYYFHQKHLSEFDFSLMGKYAFITLSAIGLIVAFRKTSKFIYFKFTDFFQKFSFICQFFLYTITIITCVFMFSLMFGSSSILRVLAVFGIS